MCTSIHLIAFSRPYTSETSNKVGVSLLNTLSMLFGNLAAAVGLKAAPNCSKVEYFFVRQAICVAFAFVCDTCNEVSCFI